MDFQIVVLFSAIFATCVCGYDSLHPLSDDFIEQINQKQTAWRAGRNFDSDTPLEEISARSSVIINHRHRIKVKRTNAEKSDIPESFDARNKWADCKSIKRVSDQANCGSCWAVASAELISDRTCIHSKGKKQVIASANDLLSCCTMCGQGCKGGDPKLALNYWIDFGVVSGGGYGINEGCQSYFLPECSHHINGSKPACGSNTNAPKCKKQCDKGSKLNYNDDLMFGKDVYGIANDQDAIKREIMDNGPVVAVFKVYTDFWSYKGGEKYKTIISGSPRTMFMVDAGHTDECYDCYDMLVWWNRRFYSLEVPRLLLTGVYNHVDGSFVSAHAVRLLGWGVEKGALYWLAANTWNQEWGDGGFFKIARGRNECGIEGAIVTGLPQL